MEIATTVRLVLVALMYLLDSITYDFVFFLFHLPNGCRSPRSSLASANAVLTALYNVLKFECNMQRHCLGFSVMGLDDAHRHLRAFSHHLRHNNSMPAQRAKATHLYFVTADVRQCYDRIDQNRLIRRTRALLRHENYVVQRSMVVRFVQSLRRTRTRVRK